MKSQFVIIDTMAGTVYGTDDEVVARDYAQSEDHYVVDVRSGVWLTPDGEEPITLC